MKKSLIKSTNMLPLNLQFFADGESSDGDDDPKSKDKTKDKEEDDEDGATVSVAEMKRRIAREKKLREDAEAKHKTDLEEAIEKAKTEASLSGKELEKYKQAEADREKKALQDRVAELELEQTRAELKEQAIATLAKKNIDVDEDALKLVVRDTAEDTLDFIDALSRILAKKKNKDASDNPPFSGGGLGGDSKLETPGQIFRNANILNKKQ